MSSSVEEKHTDQHIERKLSDNLSSDDDSFVPLTEDEHKKLTRKVSSSRPS